MKIRSKILAVLAGMAVVCGSLPVLAQQAVAQGESAQTAAVKSGMDVLRGSWVRPDGGYTITIKSIGPAGQLEAMYANPNRLPFAKAQAMQEGTTLRAFFELQAGGYAGSTYELSYDPASDRLKGIYYQAVAKQRYEIYFVRK